MERFPGTRGWGRWAAVCFSTISLVFAIGLGEGAMAAESHVFDPVLSLTGSCTTSTVDSVADPGCPEGAHPPNHFSSPRSVTTDAYGDIFVASFGQVEVGSESGKEGRVDIFDSSGIFITELAVPTGPKNVAVDSEGNLYVVNKESEVLLYAPSLYEPAGAEIAYANKPKVVSTKSLATFLGLAINPLNDHLFTHDGQAITEYSSAAEGNEVVEVIGEEVLNEPHGLGLAIDASRGRIYASDLKHSGEFPDPTVVRVFELAPPHALIETIDGSTTPNEKFLSGFLSLAVEESTGNLFVYDGGSGAEVVYELSGKGKYLATIDHELQGHWTFGAEIGVDNGENSPNGALNPFGGSYLYVPAYPAATGHSFAFGPPSECPPEVEESSFSGVSETEAKLWAEVNPCHLDTTYRFEYTTKQRYEAEGFAGATVAATGEIPAGGAPVPVSADLAGLDPGTTYRFRAVATNEKGSDEAEGEFATYPASESEPCPNDPLRTGFSALLPDCRAYELVTPPDTNGRSPMGVGWLGTYFPTLEASPGGDAVSFQIEGGSIPGYEGTGAYAGDPYLTRRTESGWSASYTGPSGAEAPSVLPGSNSPDQGYSLWSAQGKGTAVIEGQPTNYVRYPDGHSALVGRGSLGTDPRAVGKLISENGSHIVFRSSGNFPAIQLEENAPPDGTAAIYDRTADEVTHVVSLLPGDVTPAPGENAAYQGASLDGKGLAFSIGKKLYLRFNDEETYEVGEGVTFAGVAEGGARIFYLEGGDLFAFDAESKETIRFTEAGDVTPVNVAAEGTAAYFISPSVLTGGEENPNGAEAQAGKENLYLSREGTISFVGTVTKRDVEGEGANDVVDGLGLWIEAVGTGRFGKDPSRTTPDGSVLLFESRAALDGYDPEGHAEVYRYDTANNALDCLSCNPTLAPAGGEASLESNSQQKGEPEPFSSFAFVPNLRADGKRAFFQSTEALVPGDSDELQDVYEWEAQGVGGCKHEGGCLYLISSGQSLRTDYIYGVSDSGDDVFFRSADLLLPGDADETPSLYDARVGGGFAEPQPEEECLSEGCRPGLTAPPGLPTPGMLPGVEPPKPLRSCPKGKRKVVRNGEVVCVKKHKKHHHRKAGTKKGAGK